MTIQLFHSSVGLANLQLAYGLLGTLAVSLLICTLYCSWNRSQKKIKKGESTVAELREALDSPIRKSTAVPPVIKEEIVVELLAQLKILERSHFFLDAELTLSGLAKSLNSNTSYLSRVINTEKGMRFTTYINQLRIDYIYKKLLADKKLQKYSLNGLANVAGFKTAQKFSDAFYEYKGMRPSCFLKQLQQWQKR